MVSRWWKARRDFSFPKIHSSLLFPFHSPSFPSLPSSHESLSLFLSLHLLSSSFIYVFSSGYKCPRPGIASCFGNEESLLSRCPIPWACLGGQRVESNGIGWIFLSTLVPREPKGGRKEKGRWLASLFRDSRILSFEERERVVLWGRGIAFPPVDSGEECWVIPLV